MIAKIRRGRVYESFQLGSGPAYTIPEARMRIRAEMLQRFDPWFREMVWVPSESTLYSWIKAKKIDTIKGEDSIVNLTEAGVQMALTMTQKRNERKHAIERGKARGLSLERMEQIIHRCRKPDGEYDWEQINQKIASASPQRTREKAKAATLGKKARQQQ